ncbi:mitochondrial genome maintenance protein MGM101 [Histoplasma capsulatum]|uniref:Mitochondrial genome maintenance protein MGM101 n=1 Tax=Ajellomyces capsulatus TaxID=5037 RepID=A0A8A1MKD9_AJECA|nr:mitochondrial genome maintenance protein MGM101 [Histoplasma mississippiense (nom. inval.)]EDN05028.1 mitochondrial genome maintenance protein MGM101 [Histoplasma mississippiense (nom. inval.)]QSS66581.1 mitochondrial genome maintenance protein MGM101 [Histoplasma capsulatum]
MASSTLRTISWTASRKAALSVSRAQLSFSQFRSITSSSTYRQSQSSASKASTLSASASSTPTTTPASPPASSSTSTISSSNSPSRTTSSAKPTPTTTTIQNLSKTGLDDKPTDLDISNSAGNDDNNKDHIDWTRSFHGLSAQPFSKEAAEVLLQEINSDDVEIKPDGIVYLPEIKYRRILNKAFGPGGWGLAPRGESIVTAKTVTREYALVAHGRLVSVARGEQDYFSPDGIPTATEGCKSNAMMRCCKDLGVASELWDPRWIRQFKAKYTREAFVEHVTTKRRTKIWLRKDDPVSYPWKETK